MNEEKGDFEYCTYFDHEYPPSKIMWIPDVVSRLSSQFIFSIERDSKRLDSNFRRILADLGSGRGIKISDT
jgi:hypothetical protein